MRSRRDAGKKFFSPKCPETKLSKSQKDRAPHFYPLKSSGVKYGAVGHYDPPSPGRVNRRVRVRVRVISLPKTPIYKNKSQELRACMDMHAKFQCERLQLLN